MALQHILGHFGRGQLPIPHCSSASLLGSLPELSAHSFASNWQLLFLNQQKRENGHRSFFMTKSPWKNVPDRWGIELGVACMPSGHASNRATASGPQERFHTDSQANILFSKHVHFVCFGVGRRIETGDFLKSKSKDLIASWHLKHWT